MKNRLYYKPFSGLQVFCTKCRSVITKNSKDNGCNHPIEKQVYKANLIVPNTGGKRKTKNLKSKNYDDAIIELLEFKKQIEQPELFVEEDEETPDTLVDSVLIYMDYMNDIDIPHHQKKYLDKNYIVTTNGELKDFLFFIQKHIDKDIENYKIKNINDNIVGKYCEYIDAKKQSYSTYKSRIKTLRTFFNFLISKKNYQLVNVWKNVVIKTSKPTNASILKDDFYDLLNIISPEDAKKQVGKSIKNMYRPYLTNFYKLKVFTGQRNADVACLKWNMLRYNNKAKPICIESPNTKINKQKNNFKTEELEYVYIPIGEELLETLVDLGLKDNYDYDVDSYLIKPNSKNRKTIAKQASRSFTFYWNKLNIPYKRTITHLRKTYATQERIFNNSSTSILHRNARTTEKYYIDDSEIAKQMVKDGFRIFSK